MVDDERKVGGRSYQTHGPETGKWHDPYVIVLVLGTVRSPRAAERRQRRPVLASTNRNTHFCQIRWSCPRVDTCKQWYTACTLFADGQAASVSHHEVLLQCVNENSSITSYRSDTSETTTRSTDVGNHSDEWTEPGYCWPVPVQRYEDK